MLASSIRSAASRRKSFYCFWGGRSRLKGIQAFHVFQPCVPVGGPSRSSTWRWVMPIHLRGGVPSVTSPVDRIRPLDGLSRVADRPLSMRCRWFTGAILVVAAPLALPAPLSGSSLPPMMLWVWERPVDLRDLDVAHVGVAFLAATVHVDRSEVIVVHRHQPLLVPAGTARVAVARIETWRGPLSRPKTGGTCRCRAGRALRPVRRP